MSGYHSSRGDGFRIITGAGRLLPVSAGAGYLLCGEMCSGRRPLWGGSLLLPMSAGYRSLPERRITARGYYGRHSVNVTDVTNVTVNRTTNIYRYANVSNAVTVVNRDSFISGKGKYRKYDAASFSREKAVAGRPEPRPHVKEVLMPQVRKLPDSKLPPPGIAKLPVRELKERFPKIDRGAEVVSRRDRHRPEAGQAARNGKSGTMPPGMSAPAATKGKTGQPCSGQAGRATIPVSATSGT